MKNTLGTKSATARKITAKNFLWALVFLAFFTYPLSIFPPALKIGQTVFFNLIYTISIPAFIILGLLAIPILIYYRWKLPLYLKLAIIAYSLMLLINIPHEFEHFDAFLMLIGYVTIPFAAAILLKYKRFSLSTVAAWATALWFVQILVGGIALFRHTEPVGTSGNINWMAALLLMVSPWVMWYLLQKTRIWILNKRVASFLAIAIWFLPTATILYNCHSRSAWLAIILLPLFLLLIRLQRPLSKTLFTGMLVIGLLGCLAAVYIWFPTHLLRVVEKDIRLPLWTGTAVMIAKNPLGVGSGMYQEHFTPLRRVSSYHHRLYAADMTTHPHNELLNVGAQLGIPALLAFVMMISQIGRTASRNPLELCARISGYFVVLTSMFDMVLVQAPTNFLGLFFLGLNWPVLRGSPQKIGTQTVWFLPKTAAATFVTLAALVFSFFDISQDLYMRRGMIQEQIGSKYVSLDKPKEGRKYYQDAITMYKKSLVPFNTLVSLYKIGFLSMQVPEHSDQAESYLKRVADIDPNFSHLNLLFGQLSLRKRDLVAAEKFFSRECAFYPRNEKAWQTMYTFTTGISRYDRSTGIDTLLKDIYRERARQNFGTSGLQTKSFSYAQTLANRDLLKGVEQANTLLARINGNFTDPLFLELNIGKTWPASLFMDGFNVLDMQTWQLRAALIESLKEEFGTLPIEPKVLLKWFHDQIRIIETAPFTLPQTVWEQRSGSTMSAYLLFAMLCELNQSHAILNLDGTGQPTSLYIITKNVTKKSLQMKEAFHADLIGKSVTPLSPDAFRDSFRWVPGKTLVFYPFTDFLLRNQILATLVREALPHVPQSPPSIRLLELFVLTGHPPPPVTMLARYCFDRHINRLHELAISHPLP